MWESYFHGVECYPPMTLRAAPPWLSAWPPAGAGCRPTPRGPVAALTPRRLVAASRGLASASCHERAGLRPLANGAGFRPQHREPGERLSRRRANMLVSAARRASCQGVVHPGAQRCVSYSRGCPVGRAYRAASPTTSACGFHSAHTHTHTHTHAHIRRGVVSAGNNTDDSTDMYYFEACTRARGGRPVQRDT